jgi:hypothetical protein
MSSSDKRERTSPVRFRDWALIELHQNKHQTPLGKLENTEPSPLIAFNLRCMDMLRWDPHKEPKRRHCFLPGIHTFTQTGVMSEAEMRCHDYEFELPGRNVIDEDFMRVCMYGSESGESHGIANTARSVIRRFVGGVPMISEEWCILGSIQHEHRKHFSAYRLAVGGYPATWV